MKYKLFFFLLFFPIFAAAEGKNDLIVENAYMLLPMAHSSMTAGYGKLTNATDQAMKIKLLSAENFSTAEMHETISEKEISRMKLLEEITIAPGKSFTFSPGGAHLMLFDPNKKVQKSQVIHLVFSVNGKKKAIPFRLEKRD